MHVRSIHATTASPEGLQRGVFRLNIFEDLYRGGNSWIQEFWVTVWSILSCSPCGRNLIILSRSTHGKIFTAHQYVPKGRFWGWQNFPYPGRSCTGSIAFCSVFDADSYGAHGAQSVTNTHRGWESFFWPLCVGYCIYNLWNVCASTHM